VENKEGRRWWWGGPGVMEGRTTRCSVPVQQTAAAAVAVAAAAAAGCCWWCARDLKAWRSVAGRDQTGTVSSGQLSFLCAPKQHFTYCYTQLCWS